MALNTRKKITHRSWDVIPMPDTIIARVNALGTDQPEQLIFLKVLCLKGNENVLK